MNLNIQLTKEEAIVFFDFLSRFNEKDNSSFFENQAEQKVLWDIECILEKKLNEPFQSNYEEIVKKARAIVRTDLE